MRILWPVAALVALAALLLSAGPAQAHATLLDTDPADGSTLAAPPTQVVLTFSEELLAGTAQVRLTGPTGDLTATATEVGREVSAALPADLGAGRYSLLWRVTSADGHPISGTTTFTVASAAPTTSDTPAPTPSADSSTSTAAAASPDGPDLVDPLNPGASASGITKLLAGLGTVLAAGAVIAGVLARRRRPMP